jgi:hypothetical protein
MGGGETMTNSGGETAENPRRKPIIFFVHPLADYAETAYIIEDEKVHDPNIKNGGGDNAI